MCNRLLLGQVLQAINVCKHHFLCPIPTSHHFRILFCAFIPLFLLGFSLLCQNCRGWWIVSLLMMTAHLLTKSCCAGNKYFCLIPWDDKSGQLKSSPETWNLRIANRNYIENSPVWLAHYSSHSESVGIAKLVYIRLFNLGQSRCGRNLSYCPPFRNCAIDTTTKCYNKPTYVSTPTCTLARVHLPSCQRADSSISRQIYVVSFL